MAAGAAAGAAAADVRCRSGRGPAADGACGGMAVTPDAWVDVLASYAKCVDRYCAALRQGRGPQGVPTRDACRTLLTERVGRPTAEQHPSIGP